MDDFNRIIYDLQDMSVYIEDKDQELILLCSLSDSYENLFDIMFTMNDVKNFLMTKELKRKVSGGEEVSSSSLFVGT